MTYECHKSPDVVPRPTASYRVTPRCIGLNRIEHRRGEKRSRGGRGYMLSARSALMGSRRLCRTDPNSRQIAAPWPPVSCRLPFWSSCVRGSRRWPRKLKTRINYTRYLELKSFVGVASDNRRRLNLVRLFEELHLRWRELPDCVGFSSTARPRLDGLSSTAEGLACEGCANAPWPEIFP